MIEFMKENPDWFCVYLFIICCAISACADSICKAFKRKKDQ